MLKRVWNDPVGSKVIAAIIIGSSTFVITVIKFPHFRQFLVGASSIPNWFTGVLVITTLVAFGVAIALRFSRAAISSTKVESKPRIQITLPSQGGILSDPKPLGESKSYLVEVIWIFFRMAMQFGCWYPMSGLGESGLKASILFNSIKCTVAGTVE